jgi:hypothetical protein
VCMHTQFPKHLSSATAFLQARLSSSTTTAVLPAFVVFFKRGSSQGNWHLAINKGAKHQHITILKLLILLLFSTAVQVSCWILPSQHLPIRHCMPQHFK